MLRRDFQKMETFPSKSTLEEDEIDVINMTILNLLREFTGGMPTQGTFALYAQKKGHAANMALWFNLKEGTSALNNAVCESSFAAVMSAIEDVLEWPQRQRTCCEEPRPEMFGELPTGIYNSPNGVPVLVLNTTLGRFVVGFMCRHGVTDAGWVELNNLNLLLGVAQALRLMCEDDIVLGLSSETIKTTMLYEEAERKVGELMRSRWPEVTVWRLHHDDNPRKLYFG